MSKKENEGWTKACFRAIKREYKKISDSRAREIMTLTAWLLGKTHLDFHVWAQSRLSLSLSGPWGVLYEFSNINVFNMPDILQNVLWSFCILVGLLFAYSFSRMLCFALYAVSLEMAETEAVETVDVCTHLFKRTVPYVFL